MSAIQLMKKLVSQGVERTDAVNQVINEKEVSYDHARKIYRELIPGDARLKKNKKQRREKNGKKGLTEQELLSIYDKETRVREVLENLLKKGFGNTTPFWPERDVKEELGFSSCPTVKKVLNDPKYEEFKFVLANKVFWADPKNVKDIIDRKAAARPYVTR